MRARLRSRRPRHRQHPASPKLGVRAKVPDEIWHIDTSAVRLVDGSKVWLHAVIDNFSRRILAWCIAERFEISNAVAVSEEVIRNVVSSDGQPQVMTDGGVENFNADVDKLIDRGLLSRVRALVDVRCSNWMIPSWWSTLLSTSGSSYIDWRQFRRCVVTLQPMFLNTTLRFPMRRFSDRRQTRFTSTGEGGFQRSWRWEDQRRARDGWRRTGRPGASGVVALSMTKI